MTKVELQIERLGSVPMPLVGELDIELLQLEASAGARDPSHFKFDCTACIAGDEVLVRGAVSLQIEFECVKCLDFYSTKVALNNFVRSFALAEMTDAVDLAPEFREEILLTFPGFPQCSADCAGLCPVCGVNKNRKTCECELAEADDRWGGLDSLNLDD